MRGGLRPQAPAGPGQSPGLPYLPLRHRGRLVELRVELAEPFAERQDWTVAVAEQRIGPIALVVPDDEIHAFEAGAFFAFGGADHVIHELLRDHEFRRAGRMITVAEAHVHRALLVRDRYGVRDYCRRNILLREANNVEARAIACADDIAVADIGFEDVLFEVDVRGRNLRHAVQETKMREIHAVLGDFLNAGIGRPASAPGAGKARLLKFGYLRQFPGGGL